MESLRLLGFHDIRVYPTHCKRNRVSGYPKWQILKDLSFSQMSQVDHPRFSGTSSYKYISQQCFFYSHVEICAILEKIVRKP